MGDTSGVDVFHLPSAELRFTAGGPVLTMELSNSTRVERLRKLVSDLHVLPRSLFSIPELSTTGSEAVLRYPENVPALSFVERVDRLRAAPEAGVPVALRLAEFVGNASRGLEKAAPLVLPASPPLIRVHGTAGADCRMLAVPQLSPLDLGDWARVTPAFWHWLSQGQLIAGGASTTFTTGTALLDALLGPSALSERERFWRRLRGHGLVAPAMLEHVRNRLPESMHEEAQSLTSLLSDLLGAAPLASEAAAERISALRALLSPRRLATRWRYHGRADLARAVLAQAADAGSAPDEEPDAAPVGARLRISELRQAAFGGDSAALASSIASLESRLREEQDESGRLELAFLVGRFMEEPRAIQLLERRMNNRWNEAIRQLLLARLSLPQRSFAQASGHCAAASKLLLSMPEQGGSAGRYARAYLILLDAIAHFGALGALHDLSYLGDAVERLSQALALSAELGAGDLFNVTTDWLGWMATFSTLAGPDFETVRISAAALLQCFGVAYVPRATIPELPWFDAECLIPPLS